MNTYSYGTKTIEYDVQKSARKTISISVEPKKPVIIKVPKQMTDTEIEEAIAKKAYWIVQQQFLMKDIQVEKYQRDYVNGECFLYLGRSYTLQLEMSDDTKIPIVKLYQGKLVVVTNTKDPVILKAAIVRWYREKAQEIIERRIKYYEALFDKKRGRIIIKEQQKRWGSCSKTGDLMINWRIVMAQPSVIDYVIVHELCHLIHHNHSSEFWNEVARVLPNYENSKNWLMNNGIELEL